MTIAQRLLAKKRLACVLAAAVIALAACVAVPAAHADAAADAREVYVNGLTGDDANSGSKDAPVQSFSKAKELLQSTGADVIYVTGALQVSRSTETWDLDGKALKRDVGYHGELVRVQSHATLTLRNIVLDGNSASGATGISSSGDGSGGSLVGVYDGSVLTLSVGAVVQNNSIESRGNWYPEGGGGIFAHGATVNIEGGTVRDKEAVYGGGVYGIYDAVINVSSGSITGNRALQGASASLGNEYGGSGGGICAAYGADVNVSGGTISNNDAYERGGGIAMGTYYASSNDSPVLTMTGGTVSGNSAGAVGGGIFVQAGNSAAGNNGTPTYGIARITAGTIEGNSVTAEGNGSAMFGGGGIYVNGYSSSYSDFHNGVLYLNDAEISGNKASIAGGGYAACPVSVTDIELTDGSALYGNATDEGNAREVYILSSLALGTHSGNPPYSISPSMLGGGSYAWVYDDGSEVPLDKLDGVLDAWQGESLSLNNDLSAESPAVKRALGLARVHIVSNTSATRGGGIGSNGSVFIGKTVDTTEVSVTKTWADGDDADGVRPASVEVNLYRNGEYVGYQTMSADENGKWETTFANLPKTDENGNDYVYTVEERPVEGYVGAVSGSAASGFMLTNTRTVDVAGSKTWNDDDDRDGLRPDSITVNLMRDGAKVASKAVNADDGWAFTFTGLPKYDASDGHPYAYSITEDAVEGYTAEISGDAGAGFAIANTHKTETVSIPVTKKWVGGEADSATVRLFANGVDTGQTLSLTADGDWQGAFEGLPKYSDGKPIAYSITEDEVEGYVSEISGDADAGFVVTNTKPDAPTVPGGGSDEPGQPSGDEPGETPRGEQGETSALPLTGDDAGPLGVAVALAAGGAAVLAARAAKGSRLRSRARHAK